MKKKALIITGASAITVTLLVLLTIGLTGAYLSDVKDVVNQVSVTEGKVSITETFPAVTEQSMSNSFTKEVQVTNNGTTPCFVRVFADFSDSTIRNDYQTKIKSKNSYNVDITYNSWSEFLSTVKDNSDWEYIPSGSSEDEKLKGYFYYKKVLHSGQTTPPLFTDILVDYSKSPSGSNTGSNIDKITDFEMIVYAETVQTTEINSSGTVYGDSDWKQAWKSFLKVS